MNEIGWWVLALLLIFMVSDVLEKHKPKGVAMMDHKMGCAMLLLLMLFLWGFAAIVRLLFF